MTQKPAPLSSHKSILYRCYGPKPPAYTAKVPSGLLPAMELDGRLVIESDDIMKALEKEFPDNRPLMPPPTSPDQRKRAELLLRLERRLFGDWLRWLTNGWCACSFLRAADRLHLHLRIAPHVSNVIVQCGGPSGGRAHWPWCAAPIEA